MDEEITQKKVERYLIDKRVAETMKTWEEAWVSPCANEEDSVYTSEMFAYRESPAATPSLRKKQDVAPPIRVEPMPFTHEGTAKVGLDESVELFTKVLAAREEDPEFGALLAQFKAKLGLADLKKPPSTKSLGVEFSISNRRATRVSVALPRIPIVAPFIPV